MDYINISCRKSEQRRPRTSCTFNEAPYHIRWFWIIPYKLFWWTWYFPLRFFTTWIYPLAFGLFPLGCLFQTRTTLPRRYVICKGMQLTKRNALGCPCDVFSRSALRWRAGMFQDQLNVNIEISAKFLLFPISFATM